MASEGASAPLLYDRFPRYAHGHLLQHIAYQDPGTSKRRLAMADRGIGDYKSTIVRLTGCCLRFAIPCASTTIIRRLTSSG